MTIHQFMSQLNYQSIDELIEYIAKNYTYQGVKPKVTINGDDVAIDIDTHKLGNIDSEFNQAMALCSRQQFKDAIPLFQHVVSVCPAYADAWRGMAQAKMYLNRLDEAVMDNDNALRHDPSNLWALIMMGNLLLRKDRNEEALVYYERVVEYHSDDVIALNNIGVVYIKLNRLDDAVSVFQKSIAIDNTYLNAYYGIASAYMNKHEYQSAFNYALDGIHKGKVRPENADMLTELKKLLIDIANTITENGKFDAEIEFEKEKLEKMGNRPIRFSEDSTLKVYAQMRYAPVRHLDYHEVVYNPAKGKLLPHLFMHELMHLEMNIAAHNCGENCFVISRDDHFELFKQRHAEYLKELRGLMGAEDAEAFLREVMSGLMLQIMNCALDMLVEKKIFDEHKSLRPVQFVSMYKMLKEYAESAKTIEKTGYFPRQIAMSNKAMNIATAMQFRDMYGIDLVPEFKPESAETFISNKIFREYLSYKNDGYNPGDEYDFVYMIAKTFAYDEYLEFISEEEEASEDLYDGLQAKIDEQIRNNPLIKDSAEIEKRNDEFRKNHSGNAAENMMMSMYMLDAMRYFDTLLAEDVRQIAMEIAIVGLGGINPSKKGYKVQSMPGKEFGGYQFLAYYYVSFARTMPEMLAKIGLPYDDAYKMALQLYKNK